MEERGENRKYIKKKLVPPMRKLICSRGRGIHKTIFSESTCNLLSGRQKSADSIFMFCY